MKRTLAIASLFSVGWLILGCDTFTAVKGTIDTTKGTIDEAKGTADQSQDQVKAEREKRKGGGKGGATAGGAEVADDDGDRLHAKDAPLNAPIDNQVSATKGDKYDWRKVIFGGKPGIATFELHWDEESSNIDVDVYNQYGDNVGKSPPKLEGQQVKKVLVQVTPGLYYVRVSAPGKSDGSIYTLVIKWKGPGGPPVALPAAPPPPPPGGGPALPAAPPVGLAADPTKLLGTLLSAYREGSNWVLYLDKGSAARVRIGMTGNLLEGTDGDKLVDGASFSVTQVVDDKKSIAQSSYGKPLGKNKRIVLNLK